MIYAKLTQFSILYLGGYTMESAFYTKARGKTTLHTRETVKGKGLILVVDDDRSIRITTKCVLESLGYYVILAKDGLSGVKKYAERHEEIKMVILDMVMPNMEGDEAFLRMKEINPECDAIVISGHLKKEQLYHLFDDGVKGFIEKPFDPVALSELVSEVILQKVY